MNTGDIALIDLDNTQPTSNPLLVNGSCFYAAPENWMANPIATAEADMFSASILVFQILLLQHPFDGVENAIEHPESQKK